MNRCVSNIKNTVTNVKQLLGLHLDDPLTREELASYTTPTEVVKAKHSNSVAFWVSQNHAAAAVPKNVLRFSALGLVAVALAFTVRQAFQGAILTGTDIPNAENYGYSVAFLILSLIWLWRGIAGGARWLRMTGLGLLTLVTLKVFLIDAAALEGLLRVLSFMGLGGALIGIGWVYTRVLTREAEEEAQSGG